MTGIGKFMTLCTLLASLGLAVTCLDPTPAAAQSAGAGGVVGNDGKPVVAASVAAPAFQSFGGAPTYVPGPNGNPLARMQLSDNADNVKAFGDFLKCFGTPNAGTVRFFVADEERVQAVISPECNLTSGLNWSMAFDAWEAVRIPLAKKAGRAITLNPAGQQINARLTAVETDVKQLRDNIAGIIAGTAFLPPTVAIYRDGLQVYVVEPQPDGSYQTIIGLALTDKDYAVSLVRDTTGRTNYSIQYILPPEHPANQTGRPPVAGATIKVVGHVGGVPVAVGNRTGKIEYVRVNVHPGGRDFGRCMLASVDNTGYCSLQNQFPK